jgi:hypothetical protein
MWIIKLLFWRCFDKPKVGERYVHESDKHNPFKRFIYTVKKVEGGFVLFDTQFEHDVSYGTTAVRDMPSVVAFYTKLGSAK